jgi:hypothetical protein
MTEPSPGDWGPCPPGELSRLAARLAWQRRLRIAGTAGLALAAVAGLAGAVRLAAPLFESEPTYHISGPCHPEPTPCTDCGATQPTGKK